MERSGSQKFLLVISIISIIVGVLGFFSALGMIMGGAAFNMVPAGEARNALAGSGVTQGEAAGAFSMIGVMVLISSCIDLILGILGVRAANDNQKIMPVWVLAIISLVCAALSLVWYLVSLGFSQNTLSAVFSLAIAAIIFWIANNIKKEAQL